MTSTNHKRLMGMVPRIFIDVYKIRSLGKLCWYLLHLSGGLLQEVSLPISIISHVSLNKCASSNVLAHVIEVLSTVSKDKSLVQKTQGFIVQFQKVEKNKLRNAS